MTDDIDIDAERAIVDAATRGEWQCGTAGNSNLVSFNGDDIVGIAIVSGERNMTFIARARTLVPRLLDALEQASAQIEEDAHTKDMFRRNLDRAVHERDALRAELERMRSLVFKACSLGDDAAFMRKDCNAFMAGFDEIRSAAKEGR